MTSQFDRKLSSATQRSYAMYMKGFVDYCETRGRSAVPAIQQDVNGYLRELGTSITSPATINVALAAIRDAHKSARVDDPTHNAAVLKTVRDIRAKLKHDKRQVAPMTVDALRPAVAALPNSMIGIRDRAILLLGFMCALRRSELVNLEVNDVSMSTTELRVLVRRSKMDQDGVGVEILVHLEGGELCPAQALKKWLTEARISNGPIFRKVDRWGKVGRMRMSESSVALIVKRAARAAGFDAREFSSHSLRAGFCTQTVLSNVSDADAMAVSRHKSRINYYDYVRRRQHATQGSVASILRGATTDAEGDQQMSIELSVHDQTGVWILVTGMTDTVVLAEISTRIGEFGFTRKSLDGEDITKWQKLSHDGSREDDDRVMAAIRILTDQYGLDVQTVTNHKGKARRRSSL